MSPIFGDLIGFPPLLIHVGENEILLDDAIGFADRACRAFVQTEIKVVARNGDESIPVAGSRVNSACSAK